MVGFAEKLFVLVTADGPLLGAAQLRNDINIGDFPTPLVVRPTLSSDVLYVCAFESTLPAVLKAYQHLPIIARRAGASVPNIQIEQVPDLSAFLPTDADARNMQGHVQSETARLDSPLFR